MKFEISKIEELHGLQNEYFLIYQNYTGGILFTRIISSESGEIIKHLVDWELQNILDTLKSYGFDITIKKPLKKISAIKEIEKLARICKVEIDYNGEWWVRNADFELSLEDWLRGLGYELV